MNLADGRPQVPHVEVAAQLVIGSHASLGAHVLAMLRTDDLCTGLASGLNGDYGTAIAVIVPQLEQVVRTLLKRRGVHTLFVDDQTGVESEKSMTALLEMDETADIFGDGMMMELKALLVVQGAPNLRNDTAHGLLDDAAAWGYHSVYVWWFCLRLVLSPAIQILNRATNQPTDSSGGAATQPAKVEPECTQSGTAEATAEDK